MAKPVFGLTSPQISTSTISEEHAFIDPRVMEVVTRALAGSEEWAKKGNEDRHQKNFKAAIAKLTRAIAFDPNNAFAYARRGDCFFQQGKFDEAIPDLTQALKLGHNPVFVLARRGDSFRRKGVMKEAIADLDIVLKRKPKHVFALASRGDCYRENEDWDKAIADLTLAIEIMPDNAFALARRGACYLRKRWFAKAMLDFKKADQLKPNNPFTLLNMAFCFNESGDLSNSIIYADRALEIMRRLTPDDKQGIGKVVLCRGECHKLKGDLDKAITDFSEVIELIPKECFPALIFRASCYQKKYAKNSALGGLLDKAIEDLDCALKFNLGSDSTSKIYEQMGNVNVLKAELGEAIKYYTFAIRHKEEAHYYIVRAQVHKLNDDLSAASKDVERALKLDPNDSIALQLKEALEKNSH